MTEPDESEFDTGWRDIGHGVSVSWFERNGVQRAGILERHDCVDGRWGVGSVPIAARVNGYGWELVSEEPLTLTPSIMCHRCQHHGWITNGVWVPA